jgi:hypothetical protein
MSQKNALTATLTDADKQAILQQVAQVKQQLSHLLLFNLTAEDRHGLLKMGDRSMAFVNKALTYASQNPTLVPPYISVEEAVKDNTLAAQLSDIARELAVLSTALDDTIMIAGSEAYDAALQFHGSVKAASRSNTPGSQAIYEDLSQRFPGRPRRMAAATPQTA